MDLVSRLVLPITITHKVTPAIPIVNLLSKSPDPPSSHRLSELWSVFGAPL